MIMVVLKDEDIPTVKDIVHQVAGDLKQPNTGILFTLPIMNWEGVSHM
jgi:ribosomal protein L10